MAFVCVYSHTLELDYGLKQENKEFLCDLKGSGPGGVTSVA